MILSLYVLVEALPGALLSLSSCIDPERSASQAPEPAAPASVARADIADAPAEPPQVEGIGPARSITPTRSFVIVDHDPIPGYMDAMTRMPMAVPDTTLLSGIAAGDRIRFTLTVGDDVYVNALSKLNAAR